MELIVITDAKSSEKEHELILALFEAGLTTLHVRKPGFSLGEMAQFVESIPAVYRNRLVLHSHHSLVKKYNLKGYHFTETDRLKSRWRIITQLYLYPLIAKKRHVSTSYHKLEGIKKASRRYNYVFLSPVFESISKQNYKPEFNLRKAYESLKVSKCRVLALGGVQEERISLCRDAGFKGVGVLGAVWMNDDPVEQYNKIKNLCEAVQYSV